MKIYIRRKMCVDLDEIRQAICEYWSELTAEKCATLIETLREV
jgi:hypothetical protein